MIAALEAAQSGASVVVVCQAPLGQGCNTAISGGGFMMSGERFSREDHVRLTLEAGRYLNDETLVGILCQEANDARVWLEKKLNLPFNRKHNGQGYWFTQGGSGFFEQLTALVNKTSNIRLIEAMMIVDLIVENKTCRGAWGMTSSTEPLALQAASTVLATGGYAGIYARHDNPGHPVGTGISLALTAGAAVRDLEFVQFYPLGLSEPSLPTFMAFRPFPPQARVVDEAGASLTEKFLDTDDLNEAVGRHRDTFSQAIAAERDKGPVFLDLTQADWAHMDRWFSLQFLTRYDFPWQTQPAQIAPIAHHTMGGIAIDEYGQTTISGLFAVGEVASGLHGANRLGSNSLTECLVFGRRTGRQAAKIAKTSGMETQVKPRLPTIFSSLSNDEQLLKNLQQTCWHQLGLTRNAKGLKNASMQLEALENRSKSFKIAGAKRVAQTVAAFAHKRQESRGAHYRTDFPEENPAWQHSLFARWTPSGIVFVEASPP